MEQFVHDAIDGDGGHNTNQTVPLKNVRITIFLEIL